MTEFITDGRRVIWKYQFKKLRKTTFEMPDGAKIVHVEAQSFNMVKTGPESHVTMWVLVNPDNKKVKRDFKIAATGETFEADPHPLNYLGTAVFPDGTVWHALEILKD